MEKTFTVRAVTRATSVAAALSLLALAGCGKKPAEPTATAAAPAGRIDEQRLTNVASEPGSWLSTGRDGGKTHYSPLTAINQQTVGRLGFAWELKTNTNRGMQATPIVVDGTMFTSGVAGRVYALDAATGAVKWQFEPPLKLRNARGSCCDIVNRGVAVWNGKVYVASFEGILYALDANDGKIVWQTDTFDDKSRAYSITGAPQIAGKLVVIGNGGAEFDSRGYVSGYDLETGARVWRFYTVPGDPSKPQENPALEMAAKTWDPKSSWEFGGGGNAWDGIAYDAKNNLVYFGTANGAPWNRAYRSPNGGDNLFLASIIALKADTGEYVWHYQQTPGERWDYDATPPLMLSTLKLDGVDRDVLMQASKNGLFYVLDRKTGELLSADKFVDANWTLGVDMKTGRAIENPAADYTKGKPVIVFPSGVGGHNFNPMSLSASTGLVYIPTVHSGMAVMSVKPAPRQPERMAGGTAIAFATQLLDPNSMPPALRPLTDKAYLKTVPSLDMTAHLKAWDPVARKVVWEYRNTGFMDHGGVLSTGGGLVFQGGLDGKLKIFDDRTGAVLKEIDTGTPMIAAPMTYEINGTQYVAILAGSGGGGWNFWMPGNAAFERGNDNRILAFKLDGGATPMPPVLPPVAPLPEPPAAVGTPADIAAGAGLFGRNCAGCHSNADRAPVPDLRRSGIVREAAAFQSVVRGGALEKRGMPSWEDLLTEQQVDQIRAHVVNVAREAYARQKVPSVDGKQPAVPAPPNPPEAGVKEGHL